MNRKLINFQIFLTGIFSIILLAEWAYGHFSNRELMRNLQYNAEDNHEVIELPMMAGLRKNGAEYNEIVERPLFVEGRKPVVEGPPKTFQQDEVSQIDEWALIGIYEKDHHPMALFSKKNEQKKYLKISTGQIISGCTLQEIQSDRVVLLQGGQPKTVLLRKPRTEPPAAPGKPPAAVPPRPPRPPKPVAQQPNNNPENADDSNKN
ncbi:MAG: hypothetical protein ABSB19_18490 [Methylomonas sp.]|jgi:hypothetical protein